MKLTELFLNRFLYKDTSQNLETKDSAFVSADSTPASAPVIPSGGAAQDINTGNVQINGAQLEPGTFPATVLDVSNWGWGQTCSFSSSTIDTVIWGAGTFTSADGTSYAISAGTTGVMAAKTYIYLSLLDPINPTTTYKISTVPSDSVGLGKVLVAVAQLSTVAGTLATYNLSEATQIVGDNILANTINASKITTGQLIVGTNIGQGTARQNFYATPTTPYYLNDLWTSGTDIKVCTTQRLTGAYNAADWSVASNYDNTQTQLTAGADISNAKANGTTLITGGYISTSIITASNIQTGTITVDPNNGKIAGITVKSGGDIVMECDTYSSFSQLTFSKKNTANYGWDVTYIASGGGGYQAGDLEIIPMSSNPSGVVRFGNVSYGADIVVHGDVLPDKVLISASGRLRLPVGTDLYS